MLSLLFLIHKKQYRDLLISVGESTPSACPVAWQGDISQFCLRRLSTRLALEQAETECLLL